MLELYSNVSQFVFAHVLKGVRCQDIAPHRGARGSVRRRIPGVKNHVALGIPSYKITDAEDVEDPRPAMGMDWHGVAWSHVRVEHSDVFVLEQQGVVFGGGVHGIQCGRVGPGLLGAVAHRNVPPLVVEDAVLG
jgi:hypothetical protein